jgi:hypothetical protein
MKFNINAAIAGLALLTFVGARANAQAPGALGPATANPNSVNGTVTVVGTPANTITIHDRRTDSDFVVTVTGDTKYTKVANIGLAGLAVGNIVSTYSPDYTPGANSITVNRLTVLTEFPKTPANPNAEQNQYESHLVVGTVTTTTPTLTITTPAPTSLVITVTTSAQTQVLANQPATLADIVAGQRVRATGTNDGTTFTAKLVSVQPARTPRPAAN